MKKKLIIIIGVILVIIILLISLYFYGLTPVSKESDIITFTITSGESKPDIIDALDKEGLIKSKVSAYIYVAIHRNLNLQAGDYELSPNMSLEEILNKFHDGEIITEDNTFDLTFVEGRRLVRYADTIASATNTTSEEVIEVLSDPEYLNELIDEYWFLTDDILNEDIYYPLEGYLFASTYELYNGSSIKDIVKRMLDGMNAVLSNYQEEIEKSNYSIHELLTLASIVEVEGSTSRDRAGVAGVFYNRLESGWSLGSDATTYYAAGVEFSERDLYVSEINDINAYNTRPAAMAGRLPVGPICSPSEESIEAVLNPEHHDYYFFVADKNGKTYFTKTNAEHDAVISELQASGLWYEYN